MPHIEMPGEMPSLPKMKSLCANALGAGLLLLLAVPLATAQPGMPKKVSTEHVCAGCRAVVDILVKKTGPPKRRKESTVVEQLDGACDFENLRIYEFPPPTMQKACTEFLSEHEDEVEAHMLKQGKMTDAELADKICLEVTKVCKGVDLEAETAKQMSPGGQTVYMDNEKMNVDHEGKIVKGREDEF